MGAIRVNGVSEVCSVDPEPSHYIIADEWPLVCVQGCGIVSKGDYVAVRRECSCDVVPTDAVVQ